MKRTLLALAALAGAAFSGGCVERRFIIESDPPGATVFRNGQPIGVTPVDDYFIFYGDYEYILVKPGYQTLKVRQPVPTPWYEFPGLDFVSENLVPWKIRDVRRLGPYQLQPIVPPDPNKVRDRAQQLRDRGKALGPPGGAAPPAEPAPAAAPPPRPVPLGPPQMPPAPDLPQ